ncbi:MAG: hypothetical protein QXZ28_06095 [Candidatus Methanomethylicaceae archaeon]
MAKEKINKMTRLNNAASFIRKQKKVSLIRLAAYFNMCNEYARKEFGRLGDLFEDIKFEDGYFYAIEPESENSPERQGASA